MKTRDSWNLKYRPSKWEDTIGNDTEVDKLKGMLSTQSIPSALLFTGPYGCGKTTFARLFSRYLNCDTFSSCGKCRSCKLDLSSGNHPDFLEINVANSRGIDDARSMIETSRLMPTIGRMRIYLLDECHQWTPQAAQVFLKPIEEPSPKTLWLLATTEPQKLPATILSRCTPIVLKIASKQDLTERLSEIADLEEFKVSKKILSRIVEYSGGHVRDAIAMLESVFFYSKGSNGNVEENLVKVVNATPTAEIEKQASRALVGMYSSKYEVLCKAFADTTDYIPLLNNMIYQNQYIMDRMVLEDHSVIWHTPYNKRLWKWTQDHEVSRTYVINCASVLVTTRQEVQNISINVRAFCMSKLLPFVLKSLFIDTR